jgi:hypothetical protein
MSDREKLLAGLVAVAVALWGGQRGLRSYRDAVELSQNAQLAAEAALSEANTAALRGQRARARLNRWRRQSLPTQPEIAESLHQDWLRQTLQGAGLTVRELRDSTRAAASGDRKTIATTIEAQGTIPQIVDFLGRFYAAPHLHRIARTTLRRSEGGETLLVSLEVEGLILPECDRTDALATGEGELTDAERTELVARVVERNLFAPYRPRSGELEGPRQGPPSIASLASEAAAGQLALSGLTYGGSGWVAAIRNKESGRVSYHAQGGAIRIGERDATVLELTGRNMVLMWADQRYELRLGQTFSEAAEVGRGRRRSSQRFAPQQDAPLDSAPAEDSPGDAQQSTSANFEISVASLADFDD